MPTTTLQTTGTLDYNRPRTSTVVSTTLATVYDILPPTVANSTSEDVYFDLNPATVAQQSSITIAAGTTDDLYTVSIADGTTTDIYTYRQEAADTATIIATSLAQLLDLHPGVRVTSATNVITVKGVHGGTVITISVAAATTPGNLVVASVTPASGTPLYAKIAKITTTKELTEATAGNNGFPRIKMETIYYDGDATTPVVVTTKEVYTTGPSSLDAIQSDNGIARPA